MLTPQKRGWSGWSPLPRVGDGVGNPAETPLMNPRSFSGKAFLKGKGRSLVEELALPPPQASLAENGAKVANGGSADIRRSFRDAGLLDEASLRMKERETLVQNIADLEKELHEYQYNMGILLIEKKDWATKYEEISHALAEVDETLKRKNSDHLASISEFEKREENLQKILGVEQQCVSELEMALHEMRTEFAEVKFSSDKKLDDARSLEVGLEEKYLEVEQKLHSAGAKLADANGKLSDVQRKLEDIEAREQKFQKEYLCFSSEQKLHETDIIEQRKHMLDWENKLQDSQKRLVDAQKSVNEREARANDSDKVLKKKEAEFAEARITTDTQKRVLKLKEEDIRIRLSSLAAKEKEAHAKFESVEKMEKHLFAREEKLNDRERVEFQTLVDDHNALLSSKKKEFELDLERQRKSFEEEVESKICEVEKKKRETECVEDHITEREQGFEIRLQKIMDKEKDLDSQTKALKKRKESVKNDDNKLEKERQHLSSTREQVLKSKSELEGLMVALKSRKEHIKKEEENLRLTKEDREEHLLLQFNLKQEIEHYWIMKESLLRDTEDLRQQKEKFEEEWEVLEANRLSLEADTKKFIEEKQRIEKWQAKEEERLKSEALGARANFEEELEELTQKKEALQKTLEHERLDALEVLERERADMNRELELHKHEHEMDVLERREEMEKKLLDWENDFQCKKDIELNHIESLSDVNDSKSQKLLIKQERLEREKEDLSSYRKRLEVDRLEIWKDIDALRMLRKNLKLQREEFIMEKEQLLGQIRQKTCRNCGLQVSESEIFDIQDAGNQPISNLVFKESLNKKNTEPSFKDQVFPYTVSGGRMSWLQKCSLLFSPGRKVVDPSASPVDKTSLCVRFDQAAFDGQSTNKLALSFGVSEGQRVASDFGNGENADTKLLYETVEGPQPYCKVVDNSVDIMKIQMASSPRKQVEKHDIRQHEKEKPADSQPGSSTQRRDQPSKRGRLRSTKKTHSIQAIVEDGKPMLCQSFDEVHGSHNEEEKDPINIPERHENILETSLGQKRGFAQSSGMVANEHDAEGTNTHSGSILLGECRKRRQIAVPTEQIPEERRYNFRHSTIAVTNAAGQTISDQNKELKAGCQEQSTATEKAKESGGEESSKPAVEPLSDIIVDRMKAANMLQKASVDTVTEVREIETDEMIAKVEGNAAAAADDDDVQLMFSDRSGEDRFIVDDDKEQYEKRRHASIGKKIWTFFTT